MNNSLVTIHRLFRRLQQKNRFVGRVQHTGLTPIETHFLIELQANSNLKISDLRDLLLTDGGLASRVANRLNKAGYLKIQTSANDARSKILTITNAGNKLIERIDIAANQIIEQHAKNISKTEMQELCQLMKCIADGYGHPAGIKRSADTEFRVQQRRLTRCFGLLSESVYDSQLSSSSWQALAEICCSEVPPQALELAKVLSLAQNSLTSVIDKLVQNKYVRRVASKHDSRAQELCPTELGKKYYSNIEHAACLKLNEGISKNYNQQQLAKVTMSLKRFIGEFNPDAPPLLPEYRVEEIKSNEAFGKARGFAAKALIEQGLADTIPEKFLSSQFRTFALYDHDLIALIQVSSELKVISNYNSKQVSAWVCLGFENWVLGHLAL